MSHACSPLIVKRGLFGLAMVALSISFSIADEISEPVLVRVTSLKSGGIVGEIQTEDANKIQVLDIRTNQTVTISKADVTRIEKPVPLNDAARTAGLPAVVSRMIHSLASQKCPAGKVAKVTSQAVYVTLGKDSGLTLGQKLTVYHNDGDVVDPDTGVVLVSERSQVAELEVFEVGDKASKAKLINDLAARLDIGDVVETGENKFVVAVCPPSNDDGTASPTGSGLAEELTAALVQRGVTVVERSALDDVLAELLKQNTVLFNEAEAQKLGKLTGASVVLSGKIVTDKNTATAHLRLVDVTTAKILMAVSSPVKIRELTDKSAGNNGVARNGQKWITLFPPREKEVEPFPNRNDLKFRGQGDGKIANFTVNGSFGMQGNRYVLTQGQQSAITLLKDVKNFEMYANIDCGDVGGMFLLVGWKADSGTITTDTLNRRSVGWGCSAIVNGQTVGGSYVHVNGTDRLPGPQRVYLKVQDSKLSLTVGQVKICNEHPMQNDSGDVILGTFATQYGPKIVAIHALRWKPE